MELWKKFGLPKPKSEASGGELSLRENEIYSGLEIPDNYWVCVRLDGWNFHSLKDRLESPFDKFFTSCLAKAGKRLIELFNAKLAYLFSDEINLIFSKEFSFSRRVEKIDSVFSGLCSTFFLEKFKEKYQAERIGFDCRCVPLEKEEIKNYLIWRQAECIRNFYNNWSQHAFLQKGLNPREVSRKLKEKGIQERIKICRENGIEPAKKPKWQKYGVILKWKEYEKEGYNPIKDEKVKVMRRKVVEDWNPKDFKNDFSIIQEKLGG